MNSDIRIGCVIMASGMGRRFGGNKLMAAFCGQPMILRALKSTDGLFHRRIVVTRHDDVLALCQQHNVPALLHDLPCRSDTIRLGLEAIMKDLAGCMFCPGDQPLLSKNTLQGMVHAFHAAPESILRLGDGMPVIFPARTFAELLQLPEGLGGSYILKKYPEWVRSFAPLHPGETLDADTPEHLLRLEGYISEVEYELPQG